MLREESADVTGDIAMFCTIFLSTAAEYTDCACYAPEALPDWGCLCTDAERVLRLYAAGRVARPMTLPQRAWCLQEAVYYGEGMYTAAQLAPITDADLAGTVLATWVAYCRAQGGH